MASFAWGRERIEPGAFAPLGDAILNAQHDRTTPLARTDGGGLTLLDSEAALEIRAELPPTRSLLTTCWRWSGQRLCGACLSSLWRFKNDPKRESPNNRARAAGRDRGLWTPRLIPRPPSRPAAPPLRPLAALVRGCGCEVAIWGEARADVANRETLPRRLSRPWLHPRGW